MTECWVRFPKYHSKLGSYVQDKVIEQHLIRLMSSAESTSYQKFGDYYDESHKLMDTVTQTELYHISAVFNFVQLSPW